MNNFYKKGRFKHQEVRDALVFASPWFLGFFAFIVWPLIRSFVYGFQKYDILHKPSWIGISNYLNLLRDLRFFTSVYNTFYYTVFSVPLQILLALLLASLMTKKIIGLRFFRSVYFLPSVISGVAVTLIWKLMFQGDYGLINNILSYVGIRGPAWLDNPAWSKPALILMSLWSTGMTMIIYIAAMMGVPKQLYEAAKIDGASRWTQFTRITLPFITPAIFYTMVININASLQIFTQVYALTGRPPLGAPGGPADSTLVLVLYLYQKAFTFLDMGYASAMAWILFLIILLITLFQFGIAKKWVHYEY